MIVPTLLIYINPTPPRKNIEQVNNIALLFFKKFHPAISVSDDVDDGDLNKGDVSVFSCSPPSIATISSLLSLFNGDDDGGGITFRNQLPTNRTDPVVIDKNNKRS